MSVAEVEERLKRFIKLTCVANPDLLRHLYEANRTLGASPLERKHQLYMFIDVIKQALTRAIRYGVLSFDEALDIYEKVWEAFWQYGTNVIYNADINEYIKFLDRVIEILEQNPKYAEWIDKMWKDLQTLYKGIFSS